ncbi:hypothetical protein ATKI12_9107 [Kitasatospora sp. Ki12]
MLDVWATLAAGRHLPAHRPRPRPQRPPPAHPAHPATART